MDSAPARHIWRAGSSDGLRSRRDIRISYNESRTGQGRRQVSVIWGEAERSGTAQPGGGSAESYQCVCQCLVGGHKVRSRLVLALSSARMKGNGHKLKYRKFSVKIGKYVYC